MPPAGEEDEEEEGPPEVVAPDEDGGLVCVFDMFSSLKLLYQRSVSSVRQSPHSLPMRACAWYEEVEASVRRVC